MTLAARDELEKKSSLAPTKQYLTEIPITEPGYGKCWYLSASNGGQVRPVSIECLARKKSRETTMGGDRAQQCCRGEGVI